MNRFNKTLAVGLIGLTLLTNSVFAVSNRYTSNNSYNRKTFDELNSYPIMESTLKPASDKYKIYMEKVKDNGDSYFIDITGRLEYPIKISNDRISISIRDMARLLGEKVTWYQKYRMVVIGDVDKYEKGPQTENTRLVYIPLSRNIIQIDDSKKSIDTSAAVDPKLNITYLPVRSIANALDYDVKYNHSTRSVYLIK